MLPILRFWQWIDSHRPGNGEVYTLGNTAISELEDIAHELDREIKTLRSTTIEQLQELISQAEKHEQEVTELKERLQGTCHYIPDSCGFTWWDENDVEHYEEDSPNDDCGAASCDKCGFIMRADDEGWFGEWHDNIEVWWDEDGTEHHGYVLKPDFKFCPSCGARVKSRSVISDTHLSGTEQENRRSHDGGEGTSASFDPSKVTLADGDSREKLEADVREYFESWVGGAQRTQETILGWLDRQARITACKCADGWMRYKSGAEEEIGKLAQERDELQRKLDYLKGNGVEIVDAVAGGYEIYDRLVPERDKLQVECENLRDENAELKRKLDESEHEQSLYGDRISNLQRRLDAAQERIELLESTLDDTARERDELQEELDNSVHLPKGADSIPIRVGDTVLPCGGGPFEVGAIRFTGYGWIVYTYDLDCWYSPHELRHYHAPTSYEVLEEFLAEYKRDDSELCDEEIIEMFAKRLQVKENDDAD